MNKIVLLAIAVLIIIGAFLLIGGNQSGPSTQKQASPKETVTQTQAQNTQAPTQETTVSVLATKAGFLPQSLTIKAETRVVWKNQSGETITVSSDPHPTHTLYPFLNLGAFDTGSSVQVVFDKAGTYTYHNHLNASQKGKVTVE